jgi:hypothetical protein
MTPIYSAPSEAELDACSISSDVLQLESRGEGVYRLVTGREWADFRIRRDGAIFEAFYVAGNVSLTLIGVEAFETMAAARVAMELCDMEAPVC